MRNILISVPGKKEKLPLSVTHPELAKEADGWDANEFTHGSHRKMSWKCPDGHKYLSIVSDRARGTNCPFCSNNKVLAGFNDLNTKFPDIAKEADDWDPRTATWGSHKKMKWKCPDGHSYEASIKSRTLSKSKCPVCSNQKILAGFNDLNTKFPNIAKEADGWDPRNIAPGHNKKLEWKCSYGHRFQAAPNDRTSRVYNCPTCSNHKVLAGFNDLETKFPALAKEADGWDPRTVIPGSDKKLKWKCPKGHSFSSSPNSRTSGNTNCPFCSNQKVLAGFNDLKTTFPEIAKEADGWDPATVVAGSNKKSSWKCTNGHKYSMSANSRTGRGRGCPTCAMSGFDPNAKGFIYFVHHPNWQMLQIGITNNPDDRLSRHNRLGWEVLELRGPMDGHLTQQWETAILRMLKAKGADLSNSKIAGKFDGYSEAWSKSTFEVKSIKELMRLTEKFEEE